jgi:hypothetical protein
MPQQTDIDSQLCQQWADAPLHDGGCAADIRRKQKPTPDRVWARTGEASASPSWRTYEMLCTAVKNSSQLATLMFKKAQRLDK